MKTDSGSFRDPSGTVFTRNGEVLRAVFAPGAESYTRAKEKGIFERLSRKGLLIPHVEIVPGGEGVPEGTVFCLAHPRLPLVSYPWEWTFSMLKDAALLHLDLMEELLPLGFWLRDASAFNVQFDGKKVLLIDTLSLGERVPDSPWVAYRQFCSHFLAPLALAACRDVRTLALWRNYIDGYPLDLAVRMLPWKARYRPGLWMHLTLHASFQKKADRKEDLGEAEAVKTPKVSDRGLTGLVRSLRRTVEKLRWREGESLWKAYGEIRTYSSEDVGDKATFVSGALDAVKPETVWDLGANTGEFSELAASWGAFVAAVDSDAACTEFMYGKLTGEKGLPVLPLTMDLANPSPGLGWEGSERPGLADRGPADLVLALALLHHLVLTGSIPLERIARWLARISRHLVVEFVPPEDPMVKKLLRNRKDGHLPYDGETFRGAFSRLFTFLGEKALPNGRSLFLCRKK